MNASLSYFPITALINAVTSTLLGLYLLYTSFNKRVGRYLFFLCAATAFWSCSYFIWQVATSAEQAMRWSQFLMVGAIFTSIAYFHLVLVYLKLDSIKFYKIVLGTFYFFNFFWLSMVFQPVFIEGIRSISYFQFWPVAGPFFTPYLVSFVIQFVYASWLLYKNYRRSTGVTRTQTALLLLGIFIAFVGGSTNYFLWYDIPIAPWGNGIVFLYVVLTVYAMLKYRFMDIKVVFAELFTGLLLLILSVDALLSKNVAELAFRLFALFFLAVFGVFLIRSVRREVERREEVTQLAHTLEQANMQLQELDRQKTDFLSIAAHQLRTPLSILNGYIELIRDGGYGKVGKKVVEILNNMDESNGRLVTLVDEFLNITRIEQGRTKFDFAKRSLRDVIESVFKELKDRAEQKGLKITMTVPKDLVLVKMDEEKVRHVVFNFVDNAIKYSTKGTIVVGAKKEGDKMVCRVKDHGFGFDKVDEANFFQKFYRGNNVQGTNVNGTGLGLYVCKKFIEAHEGAIWAHSPGLGKGSEFGFALPL